MKNLISSSPAFIMREMGEHALQYGGLLRTPRTQNSVARAVDSFMFPVLAFGWPPLWPIIAGQFVAKVFGGLLLTSLAAYRNRRLSYE